MRREQVLDFMGAVLNPLARNVIAKCHETTARRRMDIVFDCSGTNAGLADGLGTLKCAGVHVSLATYEKSVWQHPEP
jgi:threonine dehydrogenase-like Zn-dependent dehydrogenase